MASRITVYGASAFIRPTYKWTSSAPSDANTAAPRMRFVFVWTITLMKLSLSPNSLALPLPFISYRETLIFFTTASGFTLSHFNASQLRTGEDRIGHNSVCSVRAIPGDLRQKDSIVIPRGVGKYRPTSNVTHHPDAFNIGRQPLVRFDDSALGNFDTIVSRRVYICPIPA